MHHHRHTEYSAQQLEDELLADLDLSSGSSMEEDHAELIAQLDKIVAPKDEPVVLEEAAGPDGPALEEEAMVSHRDYTTAPVLPGTEESALVAPLALRQAEAVEPAQLAPAGAPTRTCPDGYEVFDDGIYEDPSDKAADPVFICTPFRIDAMFADRQGRGWGKLVSVRSADGRWHQISIKNADLLRRSTDIIATLVDHGLKLGPDKKAKERLVALLGRWNPVECLQSVTRMGWVDDDFSAFVIGSTIVGGAAVLPPAHATGIGAGLVSRGTAVDWKDHVGAKCLGNPLMVLAVSLAFSGPLLAAMGLSGGGLHFRGASSSGKTTLLSLAASVWGGRQLVTQWRATSNGLEAIAGTMNDMLLPLDEIAEIPARELSNAIYMLANGTGKARMTKDVTLAEQSRWRLALISSGEISVQDKLSEARLDVKTGHEVRLIDIEADSRAYGAFDALHGAADASAFAETLQRLARDFHGAVGPAFVKMLISNETVSRAEALNRLVSGYTVDWLAKLPGAPDGATSRVAKRFAVIAAAGALATEFRLTGWTEHEAGNAAEKAFLDWYDRRYGTRREAVEGFVKPLQDFLTANLNSLPNSEGPHVAGTDPAGWRDGSRAYLPQTTWTRIFSGVDGTKAAQALLDMEMLLPGEEGRLARKAPRKIPGRPRLFTLNVHRVMAFKAS